MFSGIIESIGIVTDIKEEGSNKHFTIKTTLSNEAYIDQSISHNGVCLTIVSINDSTYTVTAIKETLDKTNMNTLHIGSKINLERALLANSRMDGHFVQGHVDTTAECTNVITENGSWSFFFKTDDIHSNLMVEKGSVCINGVSLTLVNAANGEFSVAIIPYTFEHTNFSDIIPGSKVNIEFDILGKYIVNYLNSMSIHQKSPLTI